MRIVITYYPPDEKNLAALVDNTIGDVLDHAHRKERIAEGGELNRIIYTTWIQSYEGLTAVQALKKRVREHKEKELKRSMKNGNRS